MNKRQIFFVLALSAGAVFLALHHQKKSEALLKAEVAQLLISPLAENHFPETLVSSKGESLRAEYALDQRFQKSVEDLFKQYKPDYGAFVAMDAESGRVLSLVSYSREPSELGNLALRATFPAASIFKVVTAAAALDQNKMTPDSVLAFNGANHTLYKKNVEKTVVNRWTRRMSLTEAFARSVNVFFGKIGILLLSPRSLEDYARRFKFNEAIASDLPVQPGTFISPRDNFSVAEVASGFNTASLMSPLQGALIAAAIVNDGVMMEPYLVDSLRNEEGALRYTPKIHVSSLAVSERTARQMRELMKATVTEGTSRKTFRDLFRKSFSADFEVGGKSGSITGVYPKGKCDWFVGYAKDSIRRVAFAALTVHEKNWRVKSSYIVRRSIEQLFDEDRVTSLRKN